MSVNDIVGLFCEVCEDAEAFTSVHIRRPNRPGSESASNLRYETCELIKKACKNIETQTLVIPLITGAMKHISTMYAVSLVELLSGAFEPRLQRYNTLIEELSSSPIALQWNDTYKKIGAVIEELGMAPDEKLLRDMPRVSEVMLSAFEFFDQYHTKTIKVASGVYSADSRSMFSRTMARFSTIGEFYDNFSMGAPENAMMIGMVAPTFDETRSPSTVWESSVAMKYATRYSGEHYSTEDADIRIRNISKNNAGFDPAVEYDKVESRIVVGIKRGENIWLMIHDDESTHNGKFLNYHGKRTSFMPFQVLFEDAPTPDTECTDLAIPRSEAWNLLSILDAEQSLWLPTFIWLVQQRYFIGKVDTEEPLVYLNEMIKLAGGNENSNLPVVRKQLSITVDPFTVPDGCETIPECNDFLKHLCITEKDIEKAVLLPHTRFGDEALYKRELWNISREALKFVAKHKLAKDYFDNHNDLNTMLIEHIEDNRHFLLMELINPESRIHRMAEHVIDKQPVVEDGAVKTKRGRYGAVQPDVMRTSVSYTRRYWYSEFAVSAPRTLLNADRPPQLF